MAFEGIICPVCSGSLKEEDFLGNIICPHCNTKLRQKKYLAFLEFLMMQGLVSDIDFFDESLYVSDSEWTRWKCYLKGKLVEGDG